MTEEKLPESIIQISNADKDGKHESWYPGRSLGDFPHPFRMVISAIPHCGKTNLIKNLIIHAQSGKTPFKDIIVCHGSKGTKEYDDVKVTQLVHELPLAESFHDNERKTLLVIDDFECCEMSKRDKANLSELFRYVSSHHDLSIIFSFQSFFDIPPIVRKCTSVYILYKPRSNAEITTMSNRIGMDADLMQNMMRELLVERWDSICIDLTMDSPNPFRLNLFYPFDPALVFR
jgi:hypothetical protein